MQAGKEFLSVPLRSWAERQHILEIAVVNLSTRSQPNPQPNTLIKAIKARFKSGQPPHHKTVLTLRVSLRNAAKESGFQASPSIS